MNIVEQEINPLDISFANQKGFEPSTPSQISQISPPTKSRTKEIRLHIRNPYELFEVQTYKRQLRHRNFTPPSRVAQVDIPRFSSIRKDHKKENYFSCGVKNTSIDIHRIVRGQKQKKRGNIQTGKWQASQMNHLHEISRLNNLINRVEKNISLHSKLYPKKYY